MPGQRYDRGWILPCFFLVVFGDHMAGQTLIITNDKYLLKVIVILRGIIILSIPQKSGERLDDNEQKYL